MVFYFGLQAYQNHENHNSKKNNTILIEKHFHYTYTSLKYGSMYEKYSIDKSKSKNRNSKSLTGKL